MHRNCIRRYLFTYKLGFVFISQLKGAYDNSICARAIVLDDAINGNVSMSTGNYFVGLQTFQNQIPGFIQNFDSMTDSFLDVRSTSGTMERAQQNLGQAITKLANIPTGTGKPLNLQYPAPLTAKQPRRTIKSLFPTTLGTVDEPSSMIGTIYNDIGDAKDQLDKVATISDY